MEIKTDSSIRKIPLVGVAYEAMRRHTKGFKNYYDRGNSFSAMMIKHLRTNELLETEKHSVYSLRHSYEDRMKEGGIDAELRVMIMGHTVDRPKYGTGGSLDLWAKNMEKISLPIDSSVI